MKSPHEVPPLNDSGRVGQVVMLNLNAVAAHPNLERLDAVFVVEEVDREVAFGEEPLVRYRVRGSNGDTHLVSGQWLADAEEVLKASRAAEAAERQRIRSLLDRERFARALLEGILSRQGARIVRDDEAENLGRSGVAV